jgi:hypothetical protein
MDRLGEVDHRWSRVRVEIGQNGEDAPVVVIGWRQAQLGEDAD